MISSIALSLSFISLAGAGQTLPKGKSIFTIPVRFPARNNRGYYQCLEGQDEHTPLFLDGGNRCIQAVELATSWHDAMAVCNSGGGHLLHVYNSRDHKKIKEWILKVNFTKSGWTGERKLAYDEVGMANVKWTLGNRLIRPSFKRLWMLSENKTIGISHEYMYGYDRTSRSMMESHRYGKISTCDREQYACGPVERNAGDFHLANATLSSGSWAICEYLTDQPSNVSFVKHANMIRREFSVISYQTIHERKSRKCVKLCALQPHCQGLNIFTESFHRRYRCNFFAHQAYDWYETNFFRYPKAKYFEKYSD